MLVLSRKPGEGILVGDVDMAILALRVYILECTNSRVKIGIEAPDDMQIRRIKMEKSDEVG